MQSKEGGGSMIVWFVAVADPLDDGRFCGFLRDVSVEGCDRKAERLGLRVIGLPFSNSGAVHFDRWRLWRGSR